MSVAGVHLFFLALKQPSHDSHAEAETASAGQREGVEDIHGARLRGTIRRGPPPSAHSDDDRRRFSASR